MFYVVMEHKRLFPFFALPTLGCQHLLKVFQQLSTKSSHKNFAKECLLNAWFLLLLKLKNNTRYFCDYVQIDGDVY